MWKKEEKARSLVGTITAAVYRRLKSIQLQGEVFVSEIIAQKWKVNATWRLSRQGASERVDAIAALVLRPSKSHSGLALLYVT